MMNNPSKYHLKKEYNIPYYNVYNTNSYSEYQLPVYYIQDKRIIKIRLLNRDLYTVKNKSKKEDIKIYDNILNNNILNTIYDFCKNIPMIMKHGSIDTDKINYMKKKSPYKDTHLMWPSFSINFNRMNIINNIFFNKLFFEYILPNIEIENKENISIDRAYINTHTLGRCGLFHKDGKSVYEKDKYNTAPTILLYINDDWNINYDGTTGFILDDDDISNIFHVEFKKGRIVVMPSYISHKMCETSTHAYRNNCLRYVIAFHLIYNQTIDKY